MGASVAAASVAFSSAERATLVSIAIEKMRQACFVDWVVGCALLAFYGFEITQGDLRAVDLWPLVATLCVTRVGNTVVKAVSDFAYWRWHHPGERDNG